MTSARVRRTSRPSAFTFRGTISEDAAALPSAAAGAVVVADEGALQSELARDAVAQAATVVTVEGRPDAGTLTDLVGRIRATASNRIVGIGAGAVIDVAKLAAFIADSESRATYPEVVLAPAGREPYRAVTAFAVVDRNGDRPTTVDPALAAADVLVIDELLRTVDERTGALIAADTAVMASESLLSLQSTALTRALGTAALDAVAGWLDATSPDEDALGGTSGHTDRPRSRQGHRPLVVAGFLVAEAMMATRLGIGHAIASPLGTVTGLTHDAINAILGPFVIRQWGDETEGLVAIARGLRVAPTAAAVGRILAELRAMAGLPATLGELGIPWSAIQQALPTSARSSGLPVLPRPLAPGDLEAFASSAWSGPSSTSREESNRAGT